MAGEGVPDIDVAIAIPRGRRCLCLAVLGWRWHCRLLAVPVGGRVYLKRQGRGHPMLTLPLPSLVAVIVCVLQCWGGIGVVSCWRSLLVVVSVVTTPRAVAHGSDVLCSVIVIQNRTHYHPASRGLQR
jgi:hypothetical protein